MVHLKDFSLVPFDIQSSDVLKAIEMAIPAEAISKAIANTQTQAERKRSLPAELVVSQVNCNEPVVKRLNAGCLEKLSWWSKWGMGKSW